MTFMSPLDSLDLSQQSHPSYPSPYNATPEAKKPRGCCGCSGCSGCLFGCLFLALIPIVAGIILYMGVGWGDYIDTALIRSYFQYKGVVVTTLKDTKVLGPDADQTIQVADSYVQSYLQEPIASRRVLRKEFLTALYYDLTGAKVPPEKVQNLNLFFQKYAPPALPPGTPPTP